MSDADLVAAIVRTWRSLDPADEIGKATEAMRLTRDHDVAAARNDRDFYADERNRELHGTPRKRAPRKP